MGYIAVDDVAAYADKVKAAGGAIHRGPTEIPNVGTFAVAGDPDGAGFLLFKGNSPDAPAYNPSAPGHVGWRELNAGDGENVFAFYAGLFGWTKTQAMPMGPSNVYQLFATKSGQDGAVFTKDAATPHPFWRFYFSVETIDAAMERVKGAGGSITAGPHEVPGGRWIAQALDPQGAAFALVAPKTVRAEGPRARFAAVRVISLWNDTPIPHSAGGPR